MESWPVKIIKGISVIAYLRLAKQILSCSNIFECKKIN